jgi:hypothetical protein
VVPRGRVRERPPPGLGEREIVFVQEQVLCHNSSTGSLSLQGALGGAVAAPAEGASFSVPSALWVAVQRVKRWVDGSEPIPPPVILTTGQIAPISPPTIPPAPGSEYDQDGYLYDPSAYSWPKPAPPTCCGAPFLAVRGCGCGVEKVRQHCDKRGCSEDYCREKIRERRARKIKRRLDAGRTDGRPVVYLVFTVPPSLRSQMVDKKRWKKAIDRMSRYLRNELGFQYLVERTDPCGEDGETWHPHLNFLGVRKQGFRGFLPPEQLASLKSKWAAICFGSVAAASGKPISVYYAYSSEEARISHWCRYLGRSWSRWEAEFPYHLRVKWLGNAPKTPPKELPRPCEKCGEEICRLQFKTESAATTASGWTYARLLEEIENQRFERLRMYGKWKSIYSAAQLPGGGPLLSVRYD